MKYQDSQIDRLHESLRILTTDLASFQHELWQHIYHRTWERDNGRHKSGILEFEDVRNIVTGRLLGEEKLLARDISSTSKLAAFSSRYKIIRQRTSNALDAANQTLAHSALLSRKESHQQAQEAVSRFEEHVSDSNRLVNSLMRTVFLSDSEAAEVVLC